jgi:hypothetical protein
MGLECAQNEVLVPEFPRIIGSSDPRYLLRPGRAKLEAMGFDRLEMGAARNDTNFMAGGCQSDRKIATDGAGTVDTEFHTYTRGR